jgi:hypothetical protein
MTPLIGFAPDEDPDIQGGINPCMNIIPSDRGMKGAPTPVTTGAAALAADCKGAVSVFKLDGTNRTIAGTVDKLYELNGTAWSDVTGAVPALGSEGRWQFTQFGNITIAATPSITLQQSASGAFASIATTIKANHITTASGFVVVGNYDNGVNNNQDGWACSAYQNYADWVPSSSTQSAFGRLLDTAGKITAMRRLGDHVAAYKERALYLGVYVGAPAVWSFQKVLGEVGCLNTGMIVSNEQYHIFLGNDDFYRFDGSNCVPLQAPCSRYVIDTLNKSAVFACQSTWDNDRGLAWWFYPSSGSTIADSWVAFHPETGKWGYGQLTVQAVVQYISGSILYSTAPDSWFYNAAPTYSYGSGFWSSVTVNLSVFQTDKKLYNLAGAAGATSMTLSDLGSDQGDSLLSRYWPRFFTYPTTCTLTLTAKYDADSAFTAVTSTTMVKGRFDVLSTALWHKVKLDFTGDWEMQGFDVDLAPDGVN